jgi:hypothetical protein
MEGMVAGSGQYHTSDIIVVAANIIGLQSKHAKQVMLNSEIRK